MTHLELLAPARTLDIGIAAIDCGADAVYIAAGEFGARQDAGNSVADIAALCTYAHRFGARIFVTVNTILYDDELSRAGDLVEALTAAGADALIVQDPAVLALARERGVKIPMHASTQCSIRTPERARFLESLGFSRLVLERELSLEEIRAVSEAVEAEIEVFVHGAVCVCYNGQCYLSQAIEGRSANRGRCIQACRSLYDLVDAKGITLVKKKALLSLKDMNLIGHVEDLARAGACSFKIEGRLKSRSYVMNTVKAYSEALDALCRTHPGEFTRAAFGHGTTAFTPDLDKTFNRGYTTLFLNGRQRGMSSMDTAGSIGENIGVVTAVKAIGDNLRVTVRPDGRDIVLANGDGFCFAGPGGEAVGFRGDVCEGNVIRCKAVAGLRPGVRIWRNISAAFEKRLRAEKSAREMDVHVDVLLRDDGLTAEARSEDGRHVSATIPVPAETARDKDRMVAVIRGQLSKKTDIYAFKTDKVRSLRTDGSIPLMSAAFLNAIRRTLCEKLNALPCKAIPMASGRTFTVAAPPAISYKENVANHLAEETYRSRGAREIGKAYECEPVPGAELMRSKYCIRYELGLCPVHQGAADTGALRLVNNGRSLRLGFDCARCEMTVLG